MGKKGILFLVWFLGFVLFVFYYLEEGGYDEGVELGAGGVLEFGFDFMEGAARVCEQFGAADIDALGLSDDSASVCAAAHNC